MNDRIILAHGSGGRATHQLVEELFYRHLGNELLLQRNDAAVFPAPRTGPGAPAAPRLAMTTDSFVVRPLFFRGGDIGRLAVCGTVNDLATSGATPLYLSLALIIEEGLRIAELERVVASIAAACQEAGVKIITGDTKVVARGQADGLYINTTGIGLVPEGVDLGGEKVRPGDAVIVSGPIGEHGIAVLSEREGIAWETPIRSDCAPLNGLVAQVLATGAEVHCFRDPTRGGLASTLNEVAAQAQVGVVIYEEAIPLSPQVRGACDMLGFDPLYVANEGKMVAFVPRQRAGEVVQAMQKDKYGKGAKIIGETTAQHPGLVVVRTAVGGERILDMPEGELLPRIC
ncbi:MAG: hydrogenase expression/formation protein HypE [Bacillota bacterium]|nr:hydrogenase expression/formation protein HypE [Bacillota bacterium]